VPRGTGVCCAGRACLLAAASVLGAAAAQQSATPEQALFAPAGDSTRTATFGTTVVVPSGLRGDIYFIREGTWVLPDFGKLEPVGTIWTSTLNVPPRHWRAGFPGVTRRFEWFAINYTGRFWIEKPGQYKFALGSDDGSKLYIDDQLVIDNDCQHEPDVRTSSITLSGGAHRIRVPYFQGPRDCVALILAVTGPDKPWRIFSTDEFKPPANPDDWKYGSPWDLTVPPNPDASRTKLSDVLGKRPRKSAPAKPGRETPSPAEGCLVHSPVQHWCGH
jgi:PA14 domain